MIQPFVQQNHHSMTSQIAKKSPVGKDNAALHYGYVSVAKACPSLGDGSAPDLAAWDFQRG